MYIARGLVRLLAAVGFVLFLTTTPLSAQNLIANPGFERVFTESEYQWVQPQGPYYHYEHTDSASGHRARTGRYVNGLCMYYGEPNEYLHVKLLKPLEAGRRYSISFHAILMRAKSLNAYRQKLIGVHLGRQRLDTHLPGDLYLEPQVNLTLPDSGRFRWFYLADTLTAEGGEQYLTLGYFAATQVAEDRAKLAARRKAEWERKYAPRKSDDDEDMAWLYLPPDEQKKYIKAQKKREKKKKKKIKGDSPVGQADFSKPETDWQAPPPEVAAAELPGYFSVRYYFDDFCLSPIDPEPMDDPTDGYEPLGCTEPDTEEVWTEGGGIALQGVFFETDSDSLLDESRVQLGALLEVLNRRAGMEIDLRGFTDNRGDPAHNLDLSRRRAHAVRQWLVDRGIDPGRVTARGYGETRPVADNETEAGRARNRRVDFVIRRLD